MSPNCPKKCDTICRLSIFPCRIHIKVLYNVTLWFTVSTTHTWQSGQAEERGSEGALLGLTLAGLVLPRLLFLCFCETLKWWDGDSVPVSDMCWRRWWIDELLLRSPLHAEVRNLSNNQDRGHFMLFLAQQNNFSFDTYIFNFYSFILFKMYLLIRVSVCAVGGRQFACVSGVG